MSFQSYLPNEKLFSYQWVWPLPLTVIFHRKSVLTLINKETSFCIKTTNLKPMYFYTVTPPLGKENIPSFEQTWTVFVPRNVLYQVCLKFPPPWFWSRRWRCEKVTSLPLQQRQTLWSGELIFIYQAYDMLFTHMNSTVIFWAKYIMFREVINI